MRNGSMALIFSIIVVTFFIFMALAVGSCSLFQMSGADKLASLPETPKQQLFQTLAKTNWLFTLSVVGVGAGFFAFLNGSSKGLQFMAACFIVISLIIGLTRYSTVIAVVSMIGTVCLMVYSVLVRNKATREIVQGVQNLRDLESLGGHVASNDLLMDSKEVITSYLDQIQSKTTKAIVKAVKGKL